MPRYVAFLRGVSPMNANMAELRRCFEDAGYTNVKTVLASGNVIFDTGRKSDASLARDVERVMSKGLDRAFPAIVRATKYLEELLESDPFARHRLPANAKRVVTFLREAPRKKIALPSEVDGARILAIQGPEVLTAYVPSAKGPVFMTLIEKTFGKDVTTRTWDTVRKCSRA